MGCDKLHAATTTRAEKSDKFHRCDDAYKSASRCRVGGVVWCGLRREEKRREEKRKVE
jgi:hypothetical protein